MKNRTLWKISYRVKVMNGTNALRSSSIFCTDGKKYMIRTVGVLVGFGFV